MAQFPTLLQSLLGERSLGVAVGRLLERCLLPRIGYLIVELHFTSFFIYFIWLQLVFGESR